jgi:NAD(P)-dependent dehydrogenase (short-subunit alcohol dehydrogenase family)
MSEPNTEAYSASKAGLLGLTNALSQSLAGKVRVNAILPGWIDTSEDDGADITRKDHAFHPVGRVGKPEDVAEMCVFLAGPNAGFITGQEFVIDGGVTKKMIYPE